ncbi:unnamed protein product, partial [marine sediment metagenome]
MTRFVYIENFLAARGLRHVYHFENDVLLYFSIVKYHSVFKRLYEGLAVTPGGPNKCMTGFMYIDNAQSLADMTDFFIETLIRRRAKKQLVPEMELMRTYGTRL